jgi:hypothetical protein
LAGWTSGAIFTGTIIAVLAAQQQHLDLYHAYMGTAQMVETVLLLLPLLLVVCIFTFLDTVFPTTRPSLYRTPLPDWEQSAEMFINAQIGCWLIRPITS